LVYETKECPMCEPINNIENRYCVSCDFPFLEKSSFLILDDEEY